jgi:hypothetical protein
MQKNAAPHNQSAFNRESFDIQQRYRPGKIA